MTWSLYEKEKFLPPITFSNGKNQEDIVNEVLDSIKEGNKLIFIHGMCGTGKSAIALNIARQLGKTSIVVPGKNLQTQYQKDYEHDKYLLKNNGLGENAGKMKISVITGRNNHPCKFIEDTNMVTAPKKSEKPTTLDIFGRNAPPRFEKKDFGKGSKSADNPLIPCKIEIKEKNWTKIREYLRQNNRINIDNFNEVKDVTRASVAFACPYWSPVLPDKYELKNFPESKRKTYQGLNDTKFVYYQGKPGCGFYGQFGLYTDSDVIVFNSLKYKIETAMNRKPLTEVEIIDECDEFLDSFSNRQEINVDYLQSSLVRAVVEKEEDLKIIQELLEIVKHLKLDKTMNESIRTKKILPLKQTGVYDLFKILGNPATDLAGSLDEENYVFNVQENSKMFMDLLDDTFVSVERRENGLYLSIVTTNLAKKFNELVEKNKVLVLMSGTLHSENILKNIFGLEEFVRIDAETHQPGTIEIHKTNLEKDCKYSNFSSGHITREEYLRSLDTCVEVSDKPTLVHVNAFNDLPSDGEVEEFGLINLISRERLREIQNYDKMGQVVRDFKEGKLKVLFSTRSARGVDFPGEQCKSIVFTKYPNPNVQDPFWKILMQNKPEFYWDFYRDKARRELLQKVYRGLRFQEDHVYVLSPDKRVLDFFER